MSAGDMDEEGLLCGSAGSIPLDQGSQEVLGLLMARGSASEQQQGSGGISGAPGGAARSRFAPGGSGPLPTFGSDPSNSRLPGGGGGLTRGPSFVGRQSSVQRVASSGGMGGGRSYVFGRGDDSNSAAPPDAGKVRAGNGPGL